MLQLLRVKNFALIDDLEITFHDGLTALTGETGAGKSIILESLQLLFGKRADQTMIRHHEQRAIVFGIFKLNHQQQELLSLPSTVEIERVVDLQGRHQMRMNGEVTTLGKLKDVMQAIGSIHSQNETMVLYDKAFYLNFIDQMDLSKSQDLLSKYLLQRSHYLDVKKHVDQLKTKKRQSLEKQEFLEYHLKELKHLDLKVGEKESLEEQIEKLKNFDRITSALRLSYQIFESQQFDYGHVYEAYKSLEKIQALDEQYASLSERLQSAYYELDDVKHLLKDQLEALDFDEEQFNQMQERSFALTKIEQKYQKSIADLIVYQREIEEELNLLTNYDGYIQEQEEKVVVAFKKAIESGNKLTELRKRLAKTLEKAILNELFDLDLEKAVFEIVFEPDQSTDQVLQESGLDQVEFYISLNEGEPVKPFAKVASGGERARFMFALKSLYAKNQHLSMLILDEIDIGISGKTAAKVANKMVDLAKERQLIVITHLPQVAARAVHHLGISKTKENNRMVTKIEQLSNDKRIEMIAMMLSDEKLSHFAIEQAKMLLKK